MILPQKRIKVKTRLQDRILLMATAADSRLCLITGTHRHNLEKSQTAVFRALFHSQTVRLFINIYIKKNK